MYNIGNILMVEWEDSYGVESGWKDISDYSASILIIRSIGKLIYEDDRVISLAHNFADETEHTPKRTNGIMVIPKTCIRDVTSCSFSCSFSCQQPESEQKPPPS